MCEKLLSQVQIAGAGAGKTYSLAVKLLERYTKKHNYKIIYAITYTNYAKNNIIKRIRELNNGYIPEDIHVETVHSFLLNEIIYPFSKYYFKTAYFKATSIKLPAEQKLQRYQLQKLNQIGIIHNSQVFNKAKQMLVCRAGETKKIQKKKELILDYLKSSIDALFIDEAQDLDEDALSLFGKLGEKVYTFIVGDPKQALKYPHKFREFTEKNVSPNFGFELLPSNVVTRRISERHLKLSNLFCPINEQQTTISTIEGAIYYIYSSDKIFSQLYDLCCSKRALIYIRQETEDFLTKERNNRFILEESVRIKLLEKVDSKYDQDAYIKSVECIFVNIAKKKGGKAAIQSFTKKYDIHLEKNEYAKLINDLVFEETNEKIKAMSIDKVKGLENDICMFIIDNSLLDYLFQKKKEINKEMMRLYVALTRSKRDLIFVVDEINLKKKNRQYVDEGFKKLNIEYIDSEYIEKLSELR